METAKNDDSLSIAEKNNLELKEKIVNGELTEEEFESLLYGSECTAMNRRNIPFRAKAANGWSVNLNVKQYEQENGYFCGPATTKQTLQFLLKSSPTQKEIAKKVGTTKDGTDGTKIVEYLNEK